VTTLRDTLRDRLDEIKGLVARKAAGEDVRPYVSTGLKSWDKNGGLLRGILTVIGAATGEGKSIVKLQLARGAAIAGHKVCMLDFEDPAGKTADRAFSGVTGINNRLLGLLDVDEFDMTRLDAAMREMEPWADRIEHHTGLLSTEKCLDLLRASDADLILVDYAQAFPEDDDKTMERTIAAFAWASNELAQRKNCAIVVFSQIIREVEQRGYRVYERAKAKGELDVSGFAPGGLSDVSWAKSLGERAKALGYIWREGRIARKLTGNNEIKDNKMRIIWGKSNFSGESDILLEFDGPTATIKDWPTPSKRT